MLLLVLLRKQATLFFVVKILHGILVKISAAINCMQLVKQTLLL